MSTQPDTTDALREKLAAAVEALNAATDPGERIDWHTEILRLRRLLQDGGAK